MPSPDARWRDGSGTVDGVRSPKSPAELAYVRRAAAVTQAAMQAGIDTAAAGVNEQEVVAEIYRAMVLAGGEYPGFAPLVRSSDTLDEEHSTWRDRVLRPGDRLFIELSGSVRRYHAPMSRIVNIGAPPRAVATAAVAARVGLEAVFDAVRPGALTGDVYAAWEAAVGDHLGVTPEPRHHCGYSVGIGFPPSWVGGSVVIGIRAARRRLRAQRDRPGHGRRRRCAPLAAPGPHRPLTSPAEFARKVRWPQLPSVGAIRGGRRGRRGS